VQAAGCRQRLRAELKGDDTGPARESDCLGLDLAQGREQLGPQAPLLGLGPEVQGRLQLVEVLGNGIPAREVLFREPVKLEDAQRSPGPCAFAWAWRGRLAEGYARIRFQ